MLVRYLRVSPRLAGSQQYPQAGTAAAALWCASLESFRQPGVGHAGWLHPLPLAVASAPGKRTASAAAQRSRASQPHHARRGVLFFASSCGSGRSLSPPGTGVQPQNVLMGAAGNVGAVVHLCCIAVCPTQPLCHGHAAASEESAVCAHCPALPAAAGSTPWRQAACPPCICPPFWQPARLSVCCGQAGGGAPSSGWDLRSACSRNEQLQLACCRLLAGRFTPIHCLARWPLPTLPVAVAVESTELPAMAGCQIWRSSPLLRRFLVSLPRTVRHRSCRRVVLWDSGHV